MDPYIVFLAATGLLILLIAWLPMVLERLPLSLPIVCVALGALAFWLADGDYPLPQRHPEVAERLTELVVIVALTGAGLKLDRPFGWRSWMTTWRLLGIAMPLSILGISLVAGWLLGMGLATALLLGAALAPTDPVLAADVQVGPPRGAEEDEVRFSLTAEAGLNDGLAFPFVNLAVLLVGSEGLQTLGEWVALDVVWKLGVGIVLGWLVGRVLAWATFHLPQSARLARTGDGFVALGITFLAYGVTELAHGYGFLAVFVAALAVRDGERENDFHDRMHSFADQIERLLMMVVLVLFGGALAGGLLAPLGWAGVMAALAFIFIVRPVAGMLALIGSEAGPWRERAVIAFFGIRGLGSIYYLAYALNAAPLAEADMLWAVLGLTVLISIVLHGVTVTPIMRALDGRRAIRSKAS